MSRHENPDLEAPKSSLILGYGPMIPLPVAAVVAWSTPAPWPIVVSGLALWWGAVILVFLSGVRRGLSFRTPGGAHRAELMSMLWLFLLGAGSLVMPTPLAALAVLVLGYASVAILDSVAARRGEAPAYFEWLRPRQMLVALLGLIGLLVWQMAAVTPI